MKRQTKIITMALTLLMALGYPAFAQDKGHEGHGHAMQEAGKTMDNAMQGMEKMDNTMQDAEKKMDHTMQGMEKMDHSGHSGMLIHESDVNGYKLAYHLIDMLEKMKNMKGMPEMKDTHHLMVYVKSPDGKALDNAKVGYLITNPDGTDQKKMTMGMAGGYGSDVDLGAKGKYTIKTKIADGDTSLIDEFEYEVK